jgi:glycosyltransferase involved in cell wall biosynthesis
MEQGSMQAEALMAVLVVYERGLAEVGPWRTLLTWLEGAHDTRSGLHLEHLLIYDNSSAPRAEPPREIRRCQYLHNSNNGGTAAAYEAAIEIASARGIQWLLLLDHDTQLPADFLDQAGIEIVPMSGQQRAVALVPWVRHGRDLIVSPNRVTRTGTFRPLRLGQKPAKGEHVSAIASGSMLHVGTLKSLLPIPKALWLDYVDHWIFAQLHRQGLRTRVVDQVLEHELSVATLAELSPARFLSVLDGEAVFTCVLGILARMVYPLRLVRRIMMLSWANPKLAAAAVGWILRRRRRQCV